MDFTWKIGGEAGYGISVTGQIFSRACMRSGAWTYDYSEYPSLIRGGHNTYQVRVADRDVTSQTHAVHLLVALDQKSYDRHKDELAADAVVLFDPANVKAPGGLPLPMSEIVKRHNGQPVMRNMVALAASLALCGVDFSVLEELIRFSFGKKGEDVVNHNIDVSKDGYDAVKEHPFAYKVPNATEEKRINIGGNESIAMGAMKSGCKFFSGYPMTPASEFMHFYAKHERSMNVMMKHTEDEIAGILMAIGAGHAGVRAMTATSGGGFALMTEALGMAAMTETPLVVVVASRPGPSTGLPTWTEQSDLRFCMHASQGDFPRIILTPGDHEECFEAGLQAFNYAEKYQVPVIILTDKYLGANARSVHPYKVPEGWTIDRGKLITDPPADYERYALTDDGISPRAVTGSCVFGAFSNEHDTNGDFTEDADMRNKMMEKRDKKLPIMQAEIEGKVRYYGPADADVTIFSWGSTKGPVLEAMKLGEAIGLKIALVHTCCVLPFPTEEMRGYLEKAKRPVLIEGNIAAQFGGVIREYTGIEIKDKYLRYDGRPFYPEQILKWLQ
ncbi:hypothetical protein COW94_00375 [Candidatus Peregrinibacteria bacterium CG22_combo_CG10-13_8_21_14_all_44_10]|nr:MAG: hypothetical protein AUK45_01995 [Candidatus Peregrinibacteria bacterium CG2_30_44_17]PIP66693.1 MAG: hypothetical protein COW94_00375 [Candidatus Peregrinibacteria bacterium CG22_combo_CG10-13_8_21_14_all_44_10]PIS04404.1 MAG: 2-oxoacid:acceptor oxidoreductase subunit alpha [Candidatus Peregrinibacteria bacterium CG10_big_fil_rev_8_21_14_0_10_44_7]PIX79706.1 MAG: 2-oxoacid:acceptor oxidoreductase subunit alpha [Candidatus Peregrinibacteria bacterium CG_4_10_14_3_um_filter_44_21]PJB8969